MFLLFISWKKKMNAMPTLSFLCFIINIVVEWTQLFFYIWNEIQNYNFIIFIIAILAVNSP